MSVIKPPTLPPNTGDTDIDEILDDFEEHILLIHRDAPNTREGQESYRNRGKAIAKAAITKKLNEARIDELKELQMAPDVSDDSKDDNYSHYIKDRISELQATKENNHGSN